KEDSLLRTSIPAKERLAATLQFLASGRSYENLKFSCAISPQALGKIIPETCAAIFDVLKEDFLKFPCNESDWMNIAVDFKKYWQVEKLCRRYRRKTHSDSSTSEKVSDGGVLMETDFGELLENKELQLAVTNKLR
ncbi:uncharacterized protein LOC124374105, partial [Homalodisca vitripennis]|uniref:uncharacterized protein LOC124374105 n=1 Tax=Homalodisca vitripennis TaxID=197043 RepID=UPI001EEBCD52